MQYGLRVASLRHYSWPGGNSTTTSIGPILYGIYTNIPLRSSNWSKYYQGTPYLGTEASGATWHPHLTLPTREGRLATPHPRYTGKPAGDSANDLEHQAVCGRAPRQKLPAGGVGQDTTPLVHEQALAHNANHARHLRRGQHNRLRLASGIVAANEFTIIDAPMRTVSSSVPRERTSRGTILVTIFIPSHSSPPTRQPPRA